MKHKDSDSIETQGDSMKNVIIKYVGYCTMVVGLAGCSSVQLHTNVFPSPQKQPEKLFVILTAPQGWAENSEDFTRSFSQEMGRCGTQTRVFFNSPKAETLSLSDDDTTREQIISEEKAFSPNAVMSIQYTSAQIVSSGYVPNIQFNLALIWRPPAIEEMPWQGSADVHSGGAFSRSAGSVLASTIFSDLKQKGLLPQCPATKND